MDATCNVAERPVPLSWSDQIQQSVVKIILPRSLNTQDAAAQVSDQLHFVYCVDYIF